MGKQPRCGVLVLDRKGEYIEDTIDQRENQVFGLQHHPKAGDRMVVVSTRPVFTQMKEQGRIRDHLKPQFNIADIDPIDLADFLPGLTPQQGELIRDYAHIPGFYEKLLAETQFGAVNNRHWYEHFPGLFDPKPKGKTLIKQFEEVALAQGRGELTDEEHAQLLEHLGGPKPDVLARAAGHVKRFCTSPLFGNSHRGAQILAAQSCVHGILDHLSQGRIVCIDMRGRDDEDYTLLAALFARRLLKVNKDRSDEEQIRACLVMEEAQNILSEEELKKGQGRGSVFIELAREGRSFKLGFVLVTQQPDPQSIATQVAKTIDTIVAFNMPPDDAKHLRRLKAGFADLELAISNAPEFHGIAISHGNPVSFQSGPVDPAFMNACVERTLNDLLAFRGDPPTDDLAELNSVEAPSTIEERLATLMQQRRESIQPVALATMRVWRRETESEDLSPEERLDS